ADIERKLAPVSAEVRKRLGNFILAEDDDTLEGMILKALKEQQGSLTIVEMFTSGQMAARIAPLPGAETVFRRGLVARDSGELWDALALTVPCEITREAAEAVASAARRQSGASHALAVLIDLDDGPDRIDFGGSICIAIATESDVASRRSRILGGREWVRLGAVELGLDCLRRYRAARRRHFRQPHGHRGDDRPCRRGAGGRWAASRDPARQPRSGQRGFGVCPRRVRRDPEPPHPRHDA